MTRLIIAPRQELLKGVVPGHVWRQGKFKFDPAPFPIESDKLEERIVDEVKQVQSLEAFTEDPTSPMVYCVAGNPDDQKAKLFAAHLVGLHMKTRRHPNVCWHSVTASYKNPLMELPSSPTMLVLTNLTPMATPSKLDKTRDILEHFTDIPIVLVVSGEDPVSFMAARIYHALHGMAYFHDGLAKKKVEIL